MAGLVEKLGLPGTEAVRLYWEKDKKRGRQRIQGGKYCYVDGNGMAFNIEQEAEKEYPRYVSVEEAPDFGIEINFDIEGEQLVKAREEAKRRRERVEELQLRAKGMIRPDEDVLKTLASAFGRVQGQAPAAGVSQEELEETRSLLTELKAEREALKKEKEELAKAKADAAKASPEKTAKKPASKSKDEGSGGKEAAEGNEKK